MLHELGPIGGVIAPSDNPLPEETPPLVFGGARPEEFFVTPIGRLQYQDDRNACTSHGETKPYENEARARGILFQVCRADCYSGGLFLDGNEGRDVGVTLASARRWINQKGVLSEYERPYKSDDVTRRTPAVLDSRRMKGPVYAGLALSVDAIKDALVISGGTPYGQEVRSNYVPDAQGVLPPPSGSLQGYHDTHWVGWSDLVAGGCFLMEQSWIRWGIDHPRASVDPRFRHLLGRRGYAWVPYGWVRPGFIFEPAWCKGSVGVE